MFPSILCVILFIQPSALQKITIEDSGLANFGINDNAMIFFIQVRETGPTSSRISVEAAEVSTTCKYRYLNNFKVSVAKLYQPMKQTAER